VKRVWVLAAALVFGFCGLVLACDRQVEDFSKFEDGAFPTGWGTRPKSGQSEFKVRKASEAYLEAKSAGTAVRIAKRFSYDLRECPFLSWQWRVIEPPQGGDERRRRTGDSGAAVYVILEGIGWPKTIKYVWSGRLKVGTRLRSPFDSKTKMVVLRNHKSPLNVWLSEKVNVYEDLKRFFPEESGEVRGIALMTDSDNTKSRAEAHYKNIAISAK